MKKLFSFALILISVILLAGCSSKELNIKVGRKQLAPHGDKSFADITVVLNGDEIIAVSLDEFQTGATADYTGVPNTNGAFGTALIDNTALFSKRVNDTKYSANMESHANATQKLSESYDAIIEEVVGMKLSELQDLVDDNNAESEPADMVAGSTLADTYGYLKAINEVAKSAVDAGTYKVNKLDVKVGRKQLAPHGDKSFADITVVRNGDLIIAVSLDEYQTGSAEDYTGVPNSDGAFGDSFDDGIVLFSKRVNDTKYSANMESHASATQKLSESYDAIIDEVEGMTVEELQELVDGSNAETEPADMVAGSTLADTYGYLKAILEVAKAAN